MYQNITFTISTGDRRISEPSTVCKGAASRFLPAVLKVVGLPEKDVPPLWLVRSSLALRSFLMPLLRRIFGALRHCK